MNNKAISLLLWSCIQHSWIVSPQSVVRYRSSLKERHRSSADLLLPLPQDGWCQKVPRTSSRALMGHSMFHTFSRMAERRLPRLTTGSKIVQWFILNLEIFYIFTLVCSSWCLKIQSADTYIKVQRGANHRSQ